MARYLEYSTPSAGHAAFNTRICIAQGLQANVPLKLNGELADPISNTASLIKHGYSRSIYIHAIGIDTSAVNFTVKGKQNGIEISEVIQGPNNSKTQSALIYDEILSITPNADNAQEFVFVGLGDKGFCGFFLDVNNSSISYNYNVTSTHTDNQSRIQKLIVYGALSDIRESNNTFLEMKTALGDNKRNNDLRQLDTAENIRFYTPTDEKCPLQQSLLLYFELDYNGDHVTTFRFLRI